MKADSTHLALAFALALLVALAIVFVWLTRLATTIDKVIVTGCIVGAVALAVPLRAEKAGAILVGLVKAAKGAA